MNISNITAILAFAALLSGPLVAQNRTRLGGLYVATDYAYGTVGQSGPLLVQTGNSATGASSITVQFAYTILGDGTRLFPLSTMAPITFLNSASGTSETITPTGTSNCNFDAGYGTCTVSATFGFVHGSGEQISSGSFGLQEAINAAHGAGFGAPRSGGVVLVDGGWVSLGGTNTTITSAIAWSNVTLQDNRNGGQLWGIQPTTLTSLAVPTTLTSGTAVFSGTGTWPASSTFLCVTYVDALGGEGPCSATFNETPGASTSLTITAPAASTGAIGWRAYTGASYNAAYLLPITASTCTLTTLESVMNACAIGSNGTWAAVNLTTTTLRPNAQTSPVVNVNLPYPQGHTVFGYTPSGPNPGIFQSNYGPFTAFGSTTSAQVDVVGSVNLPVGYMNYIGRTVRISGKMAATANTAAIPTVTVSLGWAGGTTAGAPVALCTNVGAAYGSSAAFNIIFECVATVNAVGSSAASIMTDGRMDYALAAGADGVNTVDTAVAVVGSLGLSQQDTVYVLYTSGTNTTSAVQLLDLHVETLQ